VTEHFPALTVGELSRRYPVFLDVVTAAGGGDADRDKSLAAWLEVLGDDRLTHIGMDRAQLHALVASLIDRETVLSESDTMTVSSLTIVGGRDKNGTAEHLNLVVNAGEVLCIVGPTGSGKSRLLADIECLAQGDTPSGRRILINGAAPPADWRYASGRKTIAQISQNMNFVVDLTVEAFLAMHAECRRMPKTDGLVREVIACANGLTGEAFDAATSLTQLSGGQTRALMIADTALLSASPVVLIDEIENAGIDRRRALELLIAKEKIVLISTHDPILALSGGRRLVICNGAVADVIETGRQETENLAVLEEYDRKLMELRRRLRAGERIEEPLDWSAVAAKD
jgi:ABC-type lipoprotein export system ATPase subunit